MATFSYNGRGTTPASVQSYTVQQAGTYDIAAFGGQGGNTAPGSEYAKGGAAAETGGYFNLVAGERLKVVVGGAGKQGYNGGGGGGGSFVLASTDGGTTYSLLLASGGGGGAGINGSIGFAGGNATSANSAAGSGAGGTASSGSGGAGFKSAGASAGGFNGTGATYTGSGAGGRYAGNGGFGGGGNSEGGGGGAGYSGRNGAGFGAGGAGGTSIDKGTPIAAQTLVATTRTGDGQVLVTLAQAAPAITAEAASPTGADLDAGKVVTFTLQTNESVTATGSSLALSNGATAAYASGNGTASAPLTYSYTVASGDTNTADLQATALNGTVQNGFGFALDDATFKPIDTMDQVDTVPPRITAIADSGPGVDANGNGDLGADKIVTLTVTTSEPVTVTPGQGGVTPTLTLNDGGTATYTGGSGTTQQTFSYTVAAGQNVGKLAINAVNANGAAVTDQAGNPLSPSLMNASTPTGTLVVDTTPPVVSSPTDTVAQNAGPTPIGIAAPSDNLTPAGSLAIAVTGLPSDGTVTLADGRTAVATGEVLTADQLTGLEFTPTGTSGQSSAFTYTVTDGAGNASQGTATLNVGAPGTPPTTTPTPTPAAPDAVSFSPQVRYSHGVFTLTGTASSAAGVSSVEISAVVDGGAREDLGSATLGVGGTFVFQDTIGAHVQGFLTATETDRAGGTASAMADYALTGGLDEAGGYKARQTRYTADGDAETAVDLFKANGAQKAHLSAPGQTFASAFFDTFANHGAPESTFVFDPGFGRDVVSLFRVDGADHDTLSFKGADFGDDVATVLANAHDVKGGLLITDPTPSSPGGGPGTHDTLLLKGITKALLAANPGDIAFHA